MARRCTRCRPRQTARLLLLAQSAKVRSVPLSVFLAEDYAPDVLLIHRALREHGLEFEMFVAEDGDKVIALLDRVGREIPGPDVLLLDLNLPGMNGPDLFRRVRSHPLCSNAPLIVMTSSDAPRDLAWVREFDVSYYFEKPPRLNEFMHLGALVATLVPKR